MMALAGSTTINPNGTVIIEAGPLGKNAVNYLQLPANPNQTINQNIRTTYVQTYSGIVLDDFGMGVTIVEISGTSAWASPLGMFNGQYVDGNTAIYHLYNDIYEYYFAQETSNSSPSNMAMYIHDNATGQSWKVKPYGTLQLQRSQSSPMIVNYTGSFVVTSNLIYGPPPTSLHDLVLEAITDGAAKYTQKTSTASKNASNQSQRSPNYYVVQNGDTVWAIALKYLGNNPTQGQIRTMVTNIENANGLPSTGTIIPGQRLVIP